MRTKKQIPFKVKRRFAVVVDGQTEFWYLQMLKRNERNIKVDIKPEIPQKKILSEQYAKVLELSDDYDKVFWILDFDVILSESANTKNNKRKPIDLFLEYKSALETKYRNITIIINQPCLEFWFLIHFEHTSAQFSNCESAIKQLRKHLPDYKKTERYFTKQDNDIYLKLKAQLPTAKSNSKKMTTFDKASPYSGLTEMYKLFEGAGVI